MFSPHDHEVAPAGGNPHAVTRSWVVRATGGAGSLCAIYEYCAMWRAFQTDAPESVGETLSLPSPLLARWSFTRRTTSLEYALSFAGQVLAGLQSPTPAACAELSTYVDPAAATASNAAASASQRARRPQPKAFSFKKTPLPSVFSPTDAPPQQAHGRH